MYELKRASIFKKDLKTCVSRGYDLSELDFVVKELMAGKKLDEKYLDHALKGDRKGQRDCHIKNDWVLIYEIDKKHMTLNLLRTGTHSDLL